MSSNPMYNILDKMKQVVGLDTAKPELPTTEQVYESVEARGDIMEAVRSLEEKYMGFKKTVAAIKKGGSAEDPEAVAAAIGRKKYGKKKFQKAAATGEKLGEAAKPDYIDLDKDGDRKESMKKAAKDAKKKTVKEGEYDPAPVDPEAVAKRKRLQALKDKAEDEQDFGAEKNTPIRKVAGKAYGGSAQHDAPEADDLDEALTDEQKLERYHELIKQGMDPDDAEVQVFNDEDDDELDEVAPPGAKAERMVKHIKKGYAKDGKLTPKEKSIAYATAWKAHNKGQVEEGVEFGDTIENSKAELTKAKKVKVTESRMIQEGDYFYEKLGKALAEKNPTLNTADSSFVTAVRQEMVAQGMEPNRARNIIMMDDDFISDVATSYGHYCKEIAECSAPMNSHLGGTMEELDEIARLAGLPVKETDVYSEVNTEESPDNLMDGWDETNEGNEFSGALAAAKAAGAKEFEVDGKKYTVKEDINVNIQASGEEDALNLIRKLSGMATVEAPLHNVDMGNEGAEEVDEERDVEHTNTPRELVAPIDAAVPSGDDLHREKKQYRKEYPGDNPMAVKEETLWKQYEEMINDVKS